MFRLKNVLPVPGSPAIRTLLLEGIPPNKLPERCALKI